MNLLRVDFIVLLSYNICLQEKLIRLYYFFSPNDYKKTRKQYISILKINMTEEASLEFKLRKIDETRNL